MYSVFGRVLWDFSRLIVNMIMWKNKTYLYIFYIHTEIFDDIFSCNWILISSPILGQCYSHSSWLVKALFLNRIYTYLTFELGKCLPLVIRWSVLRKKETCVNVIRQSMIWNSNNLLWSDQHSWQYD